MTKLRPEHDIPQAARAYLVTDRAVAETSARHALIKRELDEVSRNAMPDGSMPSTHDIADDEGDANAEIPATTVDTLWLALCAAPDEGWDIGELMTYAGMTRATLYRHLREHVRKGRAHQVSRGRWRAWTTQEPSP